MVRKVVSKTYGNPRTNSFPVTADVKILINRSFLVAGKRSQVSYQR